MSWREQDHPRVPADTPGGHGGEFTGQDWAGRLSGMLAPPPAVSMLEGHRLIEQRFGVQLPEPAEMTGGAEHGPPAETSTHTGRITFTPARAHRLEHFRGLGISLGGTIGLPDDVWREAGAHEAGHSLATLHLDSDQQMAALAAGARAAGLPEPRSDDHMVATYGWASRTEIESSPDGPQSRTGLLSRHLSYYGSFSNQEALADALAEYVLTQHPRPFARGVGDHVLGLLQGDQ